MFFSTDDLEFEDRKQTHRIHNSTVFILINWLLILLQWQVIKGDNAQFFLNSLVYFAPSVSW